MAYELKITPEKQLQVVCNVPCEYHTASCKNPMQLVKPVLRQYQHINQNVNKKPGQEKINTILGKYPIVIIIFSLECTETYPKIL